MKRILAGMLGALLWATAQAADAPPVVSPMAEPRATPTLEVAPERRGYAAEQPEILLRQRLFGRAHGLSLLTAACLDLPAYSQAVRDSYTAWHTKQSPTIGILVRDLAAYYFGSRAGEARWLDLSRALKLPDSIEPALGEVTLHAACASLPEAIPRQRYALDKLLAGAVDAEPAPNQGLAVLPAPTLQRPAE